MTANIAFDSYIKSLPRGERSGFIANLMLSLEVSAGTISSWRMSRTRIKLVYRREISKIIGKDIFADVTD